jgi:hypothetical protein
MFAAFTASTHRTLTKGTVRRRDAKGTTSKPPCCIRLLLHVYISAFQAYHLRLALIKGVQLVILPSVLASFYSGVPGVISLRRRSHFQHSYHHLSDSDSGYSLIALATGIPDGEIRRLFLGGYVRRVWVHWHWRHEILHAAV